MTEKLIGTIRKNGRESIRVRIQDFKGGRKIDLRQFVDKGPGQVETPFGVVIKPHMLPAVIVALQEAERVARAEGLLPPESVKVTT
jgi:hypothetical protein